MCHNCELHFAENYLSDSNLHDSRNNFHLLLTNSLRDDPFTYFAELMFKQKCKNGSSRMAAYWCCRHDICICNRNFVAVSHESTTSRDTTYTRWKSISRGMCGGELVYLCTYTAYLSKVDTLRHHELGVINRRPPLQWCTPLQYLNKNKKTIVQQEKATIRLQTFPGKII